jgi:hypothetical protein
VKDPVEGSICLGGGDRRIPKVMGLKAVFRKSKNENKEEKKKKKDG